MVGTMNFPVEGPLAGKPFPNKVVPLPICETSDELVPLAEPQLSYLLNGAAVLMELWGPHED